MQRKAIRSLMIAGGIALSALAVGMVMSRPRPLFKVEAQGLIDRELCGGKRCLIDANADLTTESGDDGIAFTTTFSAPRSHLVTSNPYGVPTGQSRYGVIGIASRTTLNWWWKSAVNIGIRPYKSPPNLVMVDDRYAGRRIEWVKRNWDRVSRADLFAELSIARMSREHLDESGKLMSKLMSKSEPARPITVDSLY